MANIQCPFCKNFMFIDVNSYSSSSVSFKDNNIASVESLRIVFYKCPSCQEFTVRAIGVGSLYKGVSFPIRPRSTAEVLPTYVPDHIRQDYEEAYLISDLSPKASATLSRRCLQSMIRDYFKVKHSNLHNEIEQIKDKIEIDSYEALMAVKSIGNVGAHPTLNPELDIIIDIEVGEAKQLLELVEMFIDEWYVARYSREQRIKKVKELSIEKGT